YWAGQDWIKATAEGTATDEQWHKMIELQESAGRAHEAIQRWMSELKEHMERNRMQDALMDNRLATINALRQGAAEQLTAARTLLNAAHPKNSAEAQAYRLAQTRLKALQGATEPQEKATVGFGRMLRQLYDWENLQTALVSTRMLRE